MRKFNGIVTSKEKWRKVLGEVLNPLEYASVSTFLAIEETGDEIVLEENETYLEYAYTAIRDMCLDCLSVDGYYNGNPTEKEFDDWIHWFEFYKILMEAGKKLLKASNK